MTDNPEEFGIKGAYTVIAMITVGFATIIFGTIYSIIHWAISLL